MLLGFVSGVSWLGFTACLGFVWELRKVCLRLIQGLFGDCLVPVPPFWVCLGGGQGMRSVSQVCFGFLGFVLGLSRVGLGFVQGGVICLEFELVEGLV